jgi:hypothetical protein
MDLFAIPMAALFVLLLAWGFPWLSLPGPRVARCCLLPGRGGIRCNSSRQPGFA